MARERIVKIPLARARVYDWVVTKSGNGPLAQVRQFLRLAR
jgi:hypothetical protein